MQHGFDKRGSHRIVAAVRRGEAAHNDRPGEGPKPLARPMLYSVEVGQVTGSTATGLQDGNSNDIQWAYTIQPVYKASSGVDGWTTIADADELTGYYFAEVGGLYTTTNVQLMAIPDDSIVMFLRVPVEQNGGTVDVEAWIVGAMNDADCA